MINNSVKILELPGDRLEVCVSVYTPVQIYIRGVNLHLRCILVI